MDNDTWQQFDYFPSSVYTLDKPSFLDNVKTVSYDYLRDIKKQKKMDKIYPMYHTYNFSNDNRIQDFSNYILNTAWNVLKNQGFNMDNLQTYYMGMWMQYHLKSSSMEQHVHPNGCKIVGFYILEAPKNCSQIVIHDPRPGKVQDSFGPEFTCYIENSTNSIYIPPKPGMLMFTNSWLPHSFTRNGSDFPFSFIHFNIGIRDYYPPPAQLPAEVI